MSIIDRIKSYYPLPIAKLHEEMRLENEARVRTRKLVNVFEGICQYLALVGLSIYLNQNLSDPEVEKARLDLARPSLGHWVGLLRSLSKCLRPSDPNFLNIDPLHDYKDEAIGIAVKIIRDVVGLERLKNVRLNSFFDTMIEFRNKKFGHGELASIEADKIKEHLESAINQWLSELTTLYERKLLYISEVKLQKKRRVYFGTQLNTGTSLESFQSEGEIDLDDKCVYLHIPADNVFLPLSPFLVYRYDTQVLYMYSDLSGQSEMRLRRLYSAPGTDDWLKMPVDKMLIIGSALDTNPVDAVSLDPNPMLHSTFIPTEMPEATIKSSPPPKRPNKENMPSNHTDNTKNDFNGAVPFANQNDVGKPQSFNEKELIQRKKDSLQKTWDSLQERVEGLRQDLIHETRREEQHRINSEIKKALNLQAEIEPELNKLISKLSKIDESRSQRVAQKIIHQTDVEQSSQGLSLLSRMMQDPRVHAVMVRSRDNFERACKQIDIMGDYKNIHDALHELEFRCFKAILQEATRFPDKSELSDLSLYLLVLSQVKNRIKDIVDMGSIPQNERTLFERLGEAEQVLSQALKMLDRKLFDGAVRRIGHVLSYDLSRINRLLNHAAASLSLPDLVDGVVLVRDSLFSYEIDKTEMQAIESGIKSLQNLSDSLTAKTKEHSDWQEISDELRLAESNLLSAIDLWPHNRERLDSLCNDSTEILENQIRTLCSDLDKAIEMKDAKKNILELFKKCNQRVGLRFQEIDGYLKDLCDQVKKLDEPITSIVNQMI